MLFDCGPPVLIKLIERPASLNSRHIARSQTMKQYAHKWNINLTISK